MKRHMAVAFASVAMLASSGCANRYVAPPPPPQAVNQTPDLILVAEQNGFRTGEADGSHDVYDGRPYRARSTKAYYDTPGYDGRLGPFGPYQNAFRNAYLRGYDKGFNRSR